MCKAIAVLVGLASLCVSNGRAQVAIEKVDDRLRVMIGSRVFTEYVFTNVSRPYFYPIYGPGQVEMTRNWPMRETPGEERDHPHQRGLWYSHGFVNGVDFWSELPGAGKIIHRGFDSMRNGGKSAVIQCHNDWVDSKGSVICSDKRTVRFSESRIKSGSRIMDFEVTIRASHGRITLGDTKEGTMAIRVPESMTVKRGAGKIVTSEGHQDKTAWGKRAPWCDYSGPTSKGPITGVAIFDHPSNLRYPTWWHVRDYGLFAANPFGKHDFENLKDAGAGKLELPEGSSVTFRYRFVFHEGDAKAGAVQAEYNAYASD